MMNIQLGLASFILGVGLHVLIFRHGEWHTFVFKFRFIHILVILMLVFVGVYLATPGKGLAEAAIAASVVVAGLVSGVLSSMIVYRAFFHRLTRHGFAGPFLARISQFHQTALAIRSARLCDEVEVLHKKYGDFVRTGPQELSIADPKAMLAIHGTNTKPTVCTTGPWYDMLIPKANLKGQRDRHLYSQRTKVWDQAFSSKALRSYEDRVNRLVSHLLGGIRDKEALPINITRWFAFWSFDLMGEMAFGEGFKLMSRNEEDYIYTTTARFLPMLSIFSPTPWLFPIFKRIPILNGNSTEFDDYQASLFWKRFQSEPKEPDVFEWIVADYRKLAAPSLQETIHMMSDVGLIVLAGSETTKLTLTVLFYTLVCHPHAYRKLQEEVDAFMVQQGAPEPEAVDNAALAKLSYLQACIDEAFRFIPPNPSGLQRTTPPEGLWIGERWIPGNVNLRTANTLIMRDPRAFVRADEFIPERWTTRRDELIVDASVHMPFSIGRFMCPGKQLALINIRRATALIAHKYDVAFAPGQTREAFLGGMLDHFTRGVPKLDLVFTLRRKT